MDILEAAIRTERGYLYPSLDLVGKLATNVEHVEQGMLYTLPGGDKVRSWRCQTLPPHASEGDACYIENDLMPGGAWFIYLDDGWKQALRLMVNNRRVFAYHVSDETNGEHKLALALPIDVDDDLRIQYAEAHHIDLLIALCAFELVICESMSTGKDTDTDLGHAEIDT